MGDSTYFMMMACNALERTFYIEVITDYLRQLKAVADLLLYNFLDFSQLLFSS